MSVSDKLSEWAKKLGLKPEDLKAEYDKELADAKVKYPKAALEQLEVISRRRVFVKHKRQLLSKAIPFEGIVLGAADAFDTVAKARKDALAKFEAATAAGNPKQAIEEGWVDDQGRPLDRKPKFNDGRDNPRYKKPLPEHNLIRNVFGVAAPKEGKPRTFRMTCNGDQAKVTPPMFVPVRFRAINKTPDTVKDEWFINSSTTTTWEAAPDLKLPAVEQIIRSGCAKFFVPIGNIAEWHELHKEDRARLVVTEGDVVTLNLTPNQRGNRTMIIDDESLGFENEKGEPTQGIMCFLPPHITIDFAEMSRVFVIGATGRMPARDPVTNQTLKDVPGPLTIGTVGVFALPEFKISVTPEAILNQPPSKPKETPASISGNEEDSSEW